MFLGGKHWWRLALPAGLAVLLAGPAWGQQAQLEPAAAPTTTPSATPPMTGEPIPAVQPATKADPLSPRTLMAGPSLYETGRIATAPAPAAASDRLIETEAALNLPKEKAIVPAAASTLEVAARPPAGVINPRVLDREIAEHFAEISNCRVDVARAKQVTPPQIVADKLLLRWIIERDGTTGPTDVVAIAPVDLAIMDCAKRVMSQWTFTRPRGGSVAVERPFAF